MKAFFMLPESKTELEKMTFEQKALLWARYSPYPYRRQTRALWYYIQCERAHATIAAKHITMLRKYMNNPDECLSRVHKSKYHLNPGTIITKTFRGLEFKVTVGDRGEFVYNNKTYRTLSAIAKEICGHKVSGNDFFGLTNKRLNHAKD